MGRKVPARDFNSVSDNETLCHVVLTIRGPQRAPLLRVMGWSSPSAKVFPQDGMGRPVFLETSLSLLIRFGVPKAELSG